MQFLLWHIEFIIQKHWPPLLVWGGKLERSGYGHRTRWHFILLLCGSPQDNNNSFSLKPAVFWRTLVLLQLVTSQEVMNKYNLRKVRFKHPCACFLCILVYASLTQTSARNVYSCVIMSTQILFSPYRCLTCFSCLSDIEVVSPFPFDSVLKK